MKKLAAILLICCILLNIVGYHILFRFYEAEAKKSMKKFLLSGSISRENTLSIIIPAKACQRELEWEGDDEFKWHGEMYDVIEKRIERNKMIIRCVNDKKETELLKLYQKMNSENNSRNKSILLLKFFANSFLPTTIADVTMPYTPLPFTIYFPASIIPSASPEVLTPPPQLG